MEHSKFLSNLARPAGLEPATSWFVGYGRYVISLVLRGFGSDETLLLPGVRREIVHRLFTTAVRARLPQPGPCLASGSPNLFDDCTQEQASRPASFVTSSRPI